MRFARRTAIVGLGSLLGVRVLAGRAGGGPTATGSTTPRRPSGWRMPAEEDARERTWMCWPSNADVSGSDIADVQDAIMRIALAIAEFEPASMLARDSIPGLARCDITDGQIDTLGRFVGATTILVDRPSVDDPDDPLVSVAEETRSVLSEASMVKRSAVLDRGDHATTRHSRRWVTSSCRLHELLRLPFDEAWSAIRASRSVMSERRA